MYFGPAGDTPSECLWLFTITLVQHSHICTDDQHVSKALPGLKDTTTPR